MRSDGLIKWQIEQDDGRGNKYGWVTRWEYIDLNELRRASTAPLQDERFRPIFVTHPLDRKLH